MRDKILFYLNQYLPEDIAVCEVKRVDERFHSRYQAVERPIFTGSIQEKYRRYSSADMFMIIRNRLM